MDKKTKQIKKTKRDDNNRMQEDKLWGQYEQEDKLRGQQ